MKFSNIDSHVLGENTWFLSDLPPNNSYGPSEKSLSN